MHVVMPELDGRILAGALSFKAESAIDQALGFTALANTPEPDRVGQVAARIAAFLRLTRTPREARRLAILIPDYPSAPGRTGYAVGLDVPASVLAMLHDLKVAGYSVEFYSGIAAYAARSPGNRKRWTGARRLPPHGRPPSGRGDGSCRSRHGETRRSDAASPASSSQNRAPFFRFRAARFGNVTVALAPDRGRSADRRADYHDASLPPRHALDRLRPVVAGEPRLPRPGPCRRPWHAGMAAGQDGRAEQELLPRDRHRITAGCLSLHRQQSRRGGTGQAPHRGCHPRPFAAADRRCRSRCASAEARTAGRRICPGRRPRPPPPRPSGGVDRRDGRQEAALQPKRALPTPTRPTRRCAASTPGSAT